MSGIFENARDALCLFPPPLWGRVREGGKSQPPCSRLTPLPALRADLPHKGGGNKKSARELQLGSVA